jgi:deazaflavin-dependent oxidoreductase (nitroreductase family)
MTATATATGSDWDTAIINEFRANDGVVGGYFAGVKLALVHHRGARSGIERIAPLATQTLDNGIAVFASKGGADTNPGWYYNLLANPDVTVEFGTETFAARAYEAKGEEYERIWSRQKADLPTFAEYERKTARDYIPVIVLERV